MFPGYHPHQVLYGFVAILMYSRFTSVMKLSSQVGLLYVMFIKMWAEVARWFSLTLFGTLGFAVAFAVRGRGRVRVRGIPLASPSPSRSRSLTPTLNLNPKS